MQVQLQKPIIRKDKADMVSSCNDRNDRTDITPVIETNLIYEIIFSNLIPIIIFVNWKEFSTCSITSGTKFPFSFLSGRKWDQYDYNE